MSIASSPRVDALVDRIPTLTPRCGDTTVVAIDGRAGSGKSTLAQALVERLHCPLVSMEALYPGWNGLQAGIASLHSSVLEPLAAGHIALVPQYDWLGHAWGSPQPLAPAPLIVLEGVGCGAQISTSSLSLLVWLELDEPTRRRRALSRVADGAVFAEHWNQWAEQEDALLATDPIPTRADFLWRTDDGHDARG